MPIDNTKLKQLYDTLKQGGYKKDYNNFRTKFLGNENYPYRYRENAKFLWFETLGRYSEYERGIKSNKYSFKIQY